MNDLTPFLVVLGVVAVIVGSTAFIINEMTRHLNAAYAAVAAVFHGRYQPGTWTSFPALSFERDGRTVIVDTFQVAKRQDNTRLRILWPDRDIRCEVYPHGIFDRLNALLGVKDIEIGSPSFDDTYLISGNNHRAIRNLLNGSVQAQVQALRRFRTLDMYVSWEGGWLTIRKQEVYRNYDELKQFIKLALDLHEAALSSRGEGIEFVGETREGVQIVSDPFALPTDHEVICRVCGEGITSESAVFCKQCRTPHHADCWKYYGACSVYACGCKQVAKPERGKRR